jgi:hypothetical protein
MLLNRRAFILIKLLIEYDNIIDIFIKYVL